MAPVKPRTIPKIWVEDGVVRLSGDYQGQLRDLFGVETKPAAVALVEHCINLSGTQDKTLKDANSAMALVAELAPTGAVEAMLATQMASVHIAMMRFSGLLASAENAVQFEIYERAFTKLARTFSVQIEALRKHRSGGTQVVVVKHVRVEAGGQAIVGNVTKGGEG